jgi:hypothetical protein
LKKIWFDGRNFASLIRFQLSNYYPVQTGTQWSIHVSIIPSNNTYEHLHNMFWNQTSYHATQELF